MFYVDGEALGIIGIAHDSSGYRVFSEYKPEFEPYLARFAVWRAVWNVMHEASNFDGDVYAVVDNDKGNRILERFGFMDVEQ